MPRWIAFDESTADALRSRQIETDAVWADLHPVSEVLRAEAAVLMMPGQDGDVCVARVRRPAQPAAAPNFEVARWTDDDAVGYAAGGMLGLLDEPVYEEEEPPVKKRWWKRILE